MAVADESYRFNELAGDAGAIADVNAAITLDGDGSITADSIRQCSREQLVSWLELASLTLNRASKV